MQTKHSSFFECIWYYSFKNDVVLDPFGGSGTTGIGNIKNNTAIKAEGDRIIIEGTNANVRIFSVDGKSATLKTTNTSNATVIDISSLNKGVYIIKANDKTVKVSKQ